MERYADEMGLDTGYNVIGRKNELIALDANMLRARMNSILLRAPAGSGKTAIVESWARHRIDEIRTFSIDLVAMGAQGENEFAARIKGLVDEVIELSRQSSKKICLFIDEVHMLGMPNYSVGLESLKPAMARGQIKLIGATTDEEYVQYIQPNQALNQRFQIFNVSEPSNKVVYKILKDMWQKELPQLELDSELLYTIIDYGRFFPSDAQPRKSIKMLDDMIGWHRSQDILVNERLLDNRIFATAGINPKWKVDIDALINNIKRRVKGQEHAIEQLDGSLNIAVAGFSDPKHPMGVFFFTGPTGTGKSINNDELVPIKSKTGQLNYKRHGDLKVGDYVFNRLGKPVKVIGVYPQGKQRAYRVKFRDGSSVVCNDAHLWTYKHNGGNGSKHWKTTELKNLINKGTSYVNKKNRTINKFKIPVNQAVQTHYINYEVDPYLVGVFIGNGCLTDSILALSSNDKFIDNKVKELLNSPKCIYKKTGYTVYFRLPEIEQNQRQGYILNYQTNDLFKDMPEINNKKSHEKSIPSMYKKGSIKQRWALIQGLFDTDGSISRSNGRYNIRYDTTSKQLALDIKEVLASLGFMSTMRSYQRNTRQGIQNREYTIHVKVQNKDKHLFFSTPCKKNIAIEANEFVKEREKKYDAVHIESVEDLGYDVDMQCIMVDDPEHLYCVTKDFIVTHNTETAKAMSEGLFGSEDNLIRFDMSEFQSIDSIDSFRYQIADAISKKPYAIVLLDEVEKAHKGVMDLLLQITDDGRLSNRYDRQVTFKNAYIIMTTNVGHEAYQESYEQGQDVTDMLRLIEKSLLKEFRPEMLGRIDAIVPFKPLSKEVRNVIGLTRLDEFAHLLSEEFNIQIRLSSRVLGFLTQEDVSRDTTSGGGRDINRRLKSTLYVPVAKLKNKIPNIAEVKLEVYGNMVIENKQQRSTEAYLGIQEYYEHLEDGNYMKYEGDYKNKIEATDEDAVTTFVSKEEYNEHKRKFRKHVKKQQKIKHLEEDD